MGALEILFIIIIIIAQRPQHHAIAVPTAVQNRVTVAVVEDRCLEGGLTSGPTGALHHKAVQHSNQHPLQCSAMSNNSAPHNTRHSDVQEGKDMWV